MGHCCTVAFIRQVGRGVQCCLQIEFGYVQFAARTIVKLTRSRDEVRFLAD